MGPASLLKDSPPSLFKVGLGKRLLKGQRVKDFRHWGPRGETKAINTTLLQPFKL